jgi:CRP-like cAMP-binding protein
MPNRPFTRQKIQPKLDGDGSGQAIHNRILSGLPAEERQLLRSKLELLDIPTHFIMNEMAAPIENCYFVNSGVASVLNVMSDGKSVEVGLAGYDGFIGLPLTVGFRTSPTQVIMQIAGSAFRIAAKDLEAALPQCPELEKRLHRYAQEMALQVTQVATCNRLHEVDKRLARWLLQSHDRVDGSGFGLTQEFLSHMLGTRRASVTIAAGSLQKQGLITYRRGYVEIVDRKGLERAACECYRILNRQMSKWQGDLDGHASRSSSARS